jgi:hypothetical protein
VRRLQRRLCAAAKRSPGRRFHALYDRICRSDVLQEAWRRVKRNKGAAGVDAQTIAAIQEHGEARFLEELEAVLRAGEYRPQAVRRCYIIDELNPVLRGWGNHFRTGNAAIKFTRVDAYVWKRLRGFMVKRKGRKLRAGEAQRWTEDFFVEQHGLYRLRGTVKYPGMAAQC